MVEAAVCVTTILTEKDIHPASKGGRRRVRVYAEDASDDMIDSVVLGTQRNGCREEGAKCFDAIDVSRYGND